MALYQQERETHEAQFVEAHSRVTAIDEVLHENAEEMKRLNWMYQKRRCDEDYFAAEWNRLTQEERALECEREKVDHVLQKQVVTASQLKELEAIGAEIRQAAEEITFERKRHILERLRTVITVERPGHDRRRDSADEGHLIIEVLGYATAVRLKRRTRTRRPSRQRR